MISLTWKANDCGRTRALVRAMLGNTNYANESKNSGDLARLIPAVAIIVMTVASWVGVFTVFTQAAQHAPSVQVTTVDSMSDSMGWR